MTRNECQTRFFGEKPYKFGFIGVYKIEIVGADVPDGPMPTRKDSLSGKDICGASRTSPPTLG